jgi:acyl carrier protein
VTPEEIRDIIFEALRRIAPEADRSEIDPAAELREQIDLDSMDLLNLVVSVDEELGIDVPESDYPHLRTLDGWVDYLVERTAGEALP